MKYAVWLVRLVFVAWMLPAGLNHFIPLFWQPLGNMPLSKELFSALDATRLFDLVKAVEVIAGLTVLFGFHVPLGLLLCMPISFCVWYWDVPLQGWGSVSAIYGWAVLVTNSLLCLSYIDTYRAMLAPRAKPHAIGLSAAAPFVQFKGTENTQLILAARLIFGGWMLVNGANYLFFQLYPAPAGSTPLAIQLMTALVHSQLFHVVMGLQLVLGALILAGFFVPLALSILMPISVCAAYWAVILEHSPIGALLALIALALNGLLLLAHLDAFKPILKRRALALGESAGAAYEDLFVDVGGRTPRGAYTGALIVMAVVATFYHYVVFGQPGEYAMLTLLFPAAVLHARRLHDMGQTGWLLLIPAIPIAAAIWFHMYNKGHVYEAPAITAALAVSALAALWCLLGTGKDVPNRDSQPAI